MKPTSSVCAASKYDKRMARCSADCSSSRRCVFSSRIRRSLLLLIAPFAVVSPRHLPYQSRRTTTIKNKAKREYATKNPGPGPSDLDTSTTPRRGDTSGLSTPRSTETDKGFVGAKVVGAELLVDISTSRL